MTAKEDRPPLAWQPPAWTAGDRIRKARMAAGLEQQQLADATGISLSSISNYERGATRPGRLQLQQLARVLGAPEAWLRDGELP